MALRYIDSMGDHYAAAQADLKWTEAYLQSRVGGLHGYALTGAFTKGVVFGSPTTIFEFYLYIDYFSDRLLTTYDSNRNEQIRCGPLNDGSIVVNRFSTSAAWPNDMVGQTPPDTLRALTWYHVGIKILHHVSAGSVEIRINGGTVLNVTGIATVSQITPSYWSGTVRSFKLGNTAGYNRFDDLVVMDDVADGIDDSRLPGGGGFTKFIGPVEVRVKRPSGPGLSAAWTSGPGAAPTPGVPNWQNVDDVDPDTDTTVNTAAPTAVGASDLFAMEDLLPGEDVLAVQSLVLARKTDEGTAALAKLSNDGVTTRAGVTVYQPSTYSYMHAPEPTAPDGSLWTAAKWNAMQYGYRRII